MPLRKTKEPLYERIGLTRKEYYNDDILKPHERDFVRKFSRLGEEIKWIKRDSKIGPNGIGYLPTNDFIWRSREWELKKPKVKKYKNIVRMIKPSIRQGKKNFIIDFENNSLSEKLLIQLETYNLKNPTLLIGKLHVLSKDRIIEILLSEERK